MNDSEERLYRHLTDAWKELAGELCALRNIAAGGLVTRCDLNAMEARIIKSLGERVNPKDLEKLSTKLEAATAPLETAVAENQPG